MSNHGMNSKKVRALRKHLLADQGDLCFWCGINISDCATLDHVKAVIDGGTNDYSNLVAACDPCNQKRSGRGPSGSPGLITENELVSMLSE